jgi:hypothetical protein
MQFRQSMAGGFPPEFFAAAVPHQDEPAHAPLVSLGARQSLNLPAPALANPAPPHIQGREGQSSSEGSRCDWKP